MIFRTKCCRCGLVEDVEWDHRPRNATYCPDCSQIELRTNLPGDTSDQGGERG